MGDDSYASGVGMREFRGGAMLLATQVMPAAWDKEACPLASGKWRWPINENKQLGTELAFRDD